MATLKEGTADQLAARLRQLADYGEAKHPPADSALAQGVADARAYADHLDELAQLAAGVTVKEGGDVFATADGLAQLIVDEATSGAYGDPSPPPPADDTWPWWLPGVVVVGAGALAYAGLKSTTGRKRSRRRGRGRRPRGLLAAVGL